MIELSCKGRSIGIIKVNDRPTPQVIGLEEQGLRRKILFHRVVEVQVILRQVGENRHLKFTTLHPSLGQGMGANFHHGIVRPGRSGIGQLLLQLHRKGRGMNRRLLKARPTHHQRAQQCRGAIGRFQ